MENISNVDLDSINKEVDNNNLDILKSNLDQIEIAQLTHPPISFTLSIMVDDNDYQMSKKYLINFNEFLLSCIVNSNFLV